MFYEIEEVFVNLDNVNFIGAVKEAGNCEKYRVTFFFNGGKYAYLTGGIQYNNEEEANKRIREIKRMQRMEERNILSDDEIEAKRIIDYKKIKMNY